MSASDTSGNLAPPGRTHRLFFALWPSTSMQSALADATRALVSGCECSPVPTQNFHLTLAFLGSVAEARIPQLGEIATRVATAFRSVARAPLTITLDRIDHWRKPEVLVATSSTAPAAAIALAETLKRTLTENSFAPDLKPFHAHATLARKVRHVTRERHMLPVTWSFREFRLITSETQPGGALYSTREIYVLDEGLR